MSVHHPRHLALQSVNHLSVDASAAALLLILLCCVIRQLAWQLSFSFMYAKHTHTACITDVLILYITWFSCDKMAIGIV